MNRCFRCGEKEGFDGLCWICDQLGRSALSLEQRELAKEIKAKLAKATNTQRLSYSFKVLEVVALHAEIGQIVGLESPVNGAVDFFEKTPEGWVVRC